MKGGVCMNEKEIDRLLDLSGSLNWRVSILSRLVGKARQHPAVKQELEAMLKKTWEDMGYTNGRPLLRCGCVAVSFDSQTGLPACIVHLGDPRAEWVDNNSPDLTGRTARCTYYGAEHHKNECPKCRGKTICECEEPSDFNLPFFKYHPDKDKDEFYCGCHSWD
jgi:hypothetical protein